MVRKIKNRLHYLLLIVLAVVHTLPLWNVSENIVGGEGDPFAHAAMGEWYCKNVVTKQYHYDTFMAPFGVSVAGNYDSPFPLILTCPFVELGAHFQFHLFTFFQVLLILFSSWLLASKLFADLRLRWLYVLFVWFGGFYLARINVHMTLLSVIWGFQLSVFAILNFEIKNLKKCTISFLLLALSLCGSFQNLLNLFLIDFLFLVNILLQYKNFDRLKIKNLAAAIGTAAIVFFLFWSPMIMFTLTNVNPVFGATESRADSSLNILNIFLPYKSNFFVEKLSLPQLNYEQINTFDLVIVIIFMIALFRKSFRNSPIHRAAITVAVCYLVLSFGPTFLFNGIILDWLSISRTPGRLAVTSYLIILVLSFRFLAELNLNERLKKIGFVTLLMWVLFWGPFANEAWLIKTIKFKPLLPMQAINVIKNDDNKNATVVMVPSAWANEPMQNFIQMLTGKPITSAYLAYPVYNEELVRKTQGDAFLSEIGCGSNALSFKNTDRMRDQQWLRPHLINHNYRYFIFNKLNLRKLEGCDQLSRWSREFVRHDWVRVIEETEHFVVAEVK